MPIFIEAYASPHAEERQSIELMPGQVSECLRGDQTGPGQNRFGLEIIFADRIGRQDFWFLTSDARNYAERKIRKAAGLPTYEQD